LLLLEAFRKTAQQFLLLIYRQRVHGSFDFRERVHGQRLALAA
jgi:hypothetical protein